ncbi:MAG: hypothetical protein ABIH38_02830 [Patescibacteria group bacterium]
MAENKEFSAIEPEEQREREGMTKKFEEARKKGNLGSIEDSIDDLNTYAARELRRPVTPKEIERRQEEIDKIDKIDKVNAIVKKMTGKRITEIDPDHLRKIEGSNDLNSKYQAKLREAYELTVGDSLLRSSLDELLKEKINPRKEETIGKDPDSEEVKAAFKYIFGQLEGFIREAQASQ